MKPTKNPLAFILGCVFAVALVLAIVSSACGQGLANTRITMNFAVRDLLKEPSTAALPDTTLNRFINYAQRETGMALGMFRDTDTSSISLAIDVHQELPSDAISGVVLAATYHNGAGGDWGLRQVPPFMVNQYDKAFAIVGDFILLGFTPAASSKLTLVYSKITTDLAADATAMTIDEEDEIAVILYAACLATQRDKQISHATLLYQMWRDHISFRGAVLPGAGQ